MNAEIQIQNSQDLRLKYFARVGIPSQIKENYDFQSVDSAQNAGCFIAERLLKISGIERVVLRSIKGIDYIGVFAQSPETWEKPMSKDGKRKLLDSVTGLLTSSLQNPLIQNPNDFAGHNIQAMDLYLQKHKPITIENDGGRVKVISYSPVSRDLTIEFSGTCSSSDSCVGNQAVTQGGIATAMRSQFPVVRNVIFVMSPE